MALQCLFPKSNQQRTWLKLLGAGAFGVILSFQFPVDAIRVRTPTGSCLNARNGPGSNHSVYTCVPNGSELLPVVEARGDWLQLSSGRWVYAPYTTYSSAGSTQTNVSTVLRRGSRGSAVKQLQERLIIAGYLNSNRADGIFGPATEAAVRRFQADYNLAVDGIAGSSTNSTLARVARNE